MKNVTFRPAEKKDCATIAKLYSISSDGVADYVWTTIAKPGDDIFAIGKQRYEREDTDFSYQNCTIAETEGVIVGMLVAFPIFIDHDYKEDDPVLAPYSDLEEDNSYYICGVALFSEYRSLGIGTRFLKLAEKHATEKGFDKLSLVVFEENKGAKALYLRHQYHEVKRAAIYPHPLIHFTGDAILMVKTLREDV